MHPIFIPSKGRPEGTTMRMLQAAHIPFTIVIEPQDIPAYQSYGYHNIYVLPQNDQGIGYARAHILEHVRQSQGQTPFWMMDDDLQTFYTYCIQDGQKVKTKCTIDVFLQRFLQQVENHDGDAAVYGPKHGTFALSAKPWTSCTDVAHMQLIFPERLCGVTYDASYRIFEDVKFLLDLATRMGPSAFVRWNHGVYYTVPSGTAVSGGVNYEHYTKEAALETLIKSYPKYVKKNDTTTRYGQPKYTILWNRLRQKDRKGKE